MVRFVVRLACLLAMLGGSLAVPGTALASPAPAAVEIHYVPRPPNTSPGPYRLQFGHSDQCLDITDRSPFAGAWLNQTPCGSNSSQLWQLQVASNGEDFRIRSLYSGLCVNVDHADYGLGTHIIQWPCGAYPNEYFKQRWDVNDGVFTPPGDLFWFVPSQSTNMALNVANGSTAPGAKVILWQRSANANEYIRLRNA